MKCSSSHRSSLWSDILQLMKVLNQRSCHHQPRRRLPMNSFSKMMINDVFVRIYSHLNLLNSSSFVLYLDPLARQNSLHRRIHSDPLFPILKDATQQNRSCADSPIPSENSFLDDLAIKQDESIPSISYSQTEEYSSYPSSYDSRGGDATVGTKQTKLTMGQSSNAEQNRHSISSQITLIDEQDQSLYDHHLPSISNNDETSLSLASTSPRDRSATMSTIDYPTRSKFIHLLLTLV